MIEVKNISKIYNKKTGEIILDNLSLQIPTGKFVTIFGESGSGKSTLLNILGLLDNDYSGKVLYNGEHIKHENYTDIQKFRNKIISFVFQDYMLVDELTVYENVRLALIESKLNNKEKNEYTINALDKLGIVEKRNEYPSNLSGGQQQRVSIARAIVKKPKIIFCDEPTGALDYENSEKVMEILKQLANDGITIIMVTHNLEYKSRSDFSIHLRSGKIVETSGKNI